METVVYENTCSNFILKLLKAGYKETFYKHANKNNNDLQFLKCSIGLNNG